MKVFATLLLLTLIIGAYFLFQKGQQNTTDRIVLNHTTYSTNRIDNFTGKGELKASLSPINYKDEEGIWHEYDTTLIDSTNPDYAYQPKSSDIKVLFKKQLDSHLIQIETNGQKILLSPQTLEYRNSNQTQIIALPNQSARGILSDNSITYKDMYGPGIDLKFSVTSTQVFKELIVNSKSALPSPTFNNAHLSFSLGFSYSEDADIKIGDRVWDGKNTQVEDTVTVFSDRSEPIFTLGAPFAYDSSSPKKRITTGTSSHNNTDQKIVYSLERHSTPQASVQIPHSWLSNATFPVTIDPTVNLQVSASSDDGFEEINVGFGDITNSIITYGTYPELASPAVSGVRFLNVTVPQGSTIDSATLTLTSQEEYDCGSCTVQAIIYGEDADNPSTFTTADGNIYNRTQTTANSGNILLPTALGELEEVEIDVAAPVQEIINRGGFSSGNALVLLIWDNGSDEWKQFYSYDGSSADAAELDIEYSVADTPTPTPTPTSTPTPTTGPTPTPTPAPLVNTVTYQVTASGDDRRQEEGTTTSVADSEGDFSVGTGNTASSPNQHNLWRFLSVTVPQGAEISSATVSLRKDGAAWLQNQWTWYGQDADNVTSVTGRIDTRPKTSASTTENTNVQRTNNTWYDWDVTDIVQEIIDRPGWSSGNNMVLITDGDGASSFARTLWYEYNEDPSSAGMLEIEYENPPGTVDFESVNLDGVDLE